MSIVFRLALLTLIAAYVIYRLGLSFASIRAQRAGDVDRAAELRARGVMLMMGVGVGLVLVFVAVVLVREIA
jgi:hypothetical protein